MFIFKKDAIYSKHHKGDIYIGNAIRLNYCKDYIHKTKAIKSVFENMHIALHHSVFIFGIGYMLKKNEEKARSTEFAVDADLPTEYETRKKEKKKPKEAKEDKTEIDPELAKAREEYMKEFGKKGHHSWDTETILKKIKEHKTEKVD